MRTLQSYIKLFTFIFLLVSFTACKKNDYPCPGLGQSNEDDFSLFDEEGKLKDPKSMKGKKQGRINKETGLVNKKNPKRLKAPQKRHI